MSRLIVAGGRGFFGRTAVELLRGLELRPLVASRHAGADLVLDVENRAVLDATVRAGDLVVDAAGPYQRRSSTLIDAAIAIGFDVVDLSDSLSYTRMIHERRDRIDQAGIRVLTACSSASAVVATLIRRTGISRPHRVSVFLSPASRYTASAGTLGALQHSLGRPIEVLRHGTLTHRKGWSESRALDWPSPFGFRRGYLLETVDAVTLPPIWPSLHRVDLFVDVGPFGPLLSVVSVMAPIRALLPVVQAPVLRMMHRFGRTQGGFAVEVQQADGTTAAYALLSGGRSYVTAVAPAALAARAIINAGTRNQERGTRDGGRGIVPADRQVASDELFAFLEEQGIHVFSGRTEGGRMIWTGTGITHRS